MFRIPPKGHRLLRVLTPLLSSALFGYLIWQAGLSKLWENAEKLGWGFLWMLALGGVSHAARTLAWRLTLDDYKHKISFARMLGLRLGAEAAGQFGIIGQTVGESIRVSRLSPHIPLGNAIASVTLDRGLYVGTGIIVLIAGLAGARPVLSHSHALNLYATFLVFALVFILLAALLALRKRWAVVTRCAQFCGRAPYLRRWVESRHALFQSVENAVLDFHHKSHRAFWGSLLLMLGSHCLAVTEVCLILLLLGVKFGVLSALVVEAMTKLVNVVGSLNPGNVGTFEAGTVLIGRMFGLSVATALTLGLARRLRAFFWTAVGGICLFILIKPTSRGNADGRSMPEVAAKDAEEGADPPFGVTPEREFAVAIFLSTKGTSGGELGSGLAHVGSLPILLRNILAARKLWPAQIIVVVDNPVLMRLVQHELCSTGRLPKSVQWIEIEAEVSVRQRLQLISAHARSERLITIDGNTIYHPSLLQGAKDWYGEGAGFVLSTGGKPIGICAFTAEAILEPQKSCPAAAGTLSEFLDCLEKIHSFTDIPVAADLWQRVTTEEDRQSAERKLDRWLVKPTDGIYARLNRRISIPISRQLIKFPISANMVTLFTLVVGLASGTFFALGGYWNTLLGALWCLWSSILDGCDGEVARLKLQDSAFGCWLETVCDYLFYLILFAGMTLGLWRSSGAKLYLALGTLLLFGAIASFLAIGWQRHRLAAERPEQLLKIWQSQAESRSSNPFLYFARHTEFIVRRCFFPYALLFFALFNIMNVALVLSAIGANLAWPIALYSSRTFSAAQRSTVNRFAVHGLTS